MSELSELIHNANLTKTQKMIAKYILDYSADACFMTSTEIALKLNVSESSVIRFSRSLGFGGFMDFQKMLRKEYQDKVSAYPIPSPYLPSESLSAQSWNEIPITSIGILRMPFKIWKPYLPPIH